jgi:hypothetical protein
LSRCFFCAGERSIAHTLFTSPERISGGVPTQFLELLDFMIAFRFTQCDTERAGRTMTLTKPALRASLGGSGRSTSSRRFGSHSTLLASTRSTSTLQAFVRRWKADGHLSAIMKDRDAERARQVLERKAAEHKPSFLGLATPLE